MTADLILVGLIAVVGVGGLGLLMFKSWQDQKTGAALEAGKVSQVAAETEVKIAQAEADAPKTQAAITDRFKAATF